MNAGKAHRIVEIQNQLKEQTVLESELASLRKSVEVNRQQQNSSIFFLSSVPKEKSRCKHTLDSLKKELSNFKDG